ncbi:hypothetical protein [Enterococcus faecalis]|uniref:hypothetical protein n=1 Tax=Enterococcus faecalis TaxID=1351 RepID=UPI0010A5AA5D|nr:hypothetical protein [Enterococcus faecalis]
MKQRRKRHRFLINFVFYLKNDDLVFEDIYYIGERSIMTKIELEKLRKEIIRENGVHDASIVSVNKLY